MNLQCLNAVAFLEVVHFGRLRRPEGLVTLRSLRGLSPQRKERRENSSVRELRKRFFSPHGLRKKKRKSRKIGRIIDDPRSGNLFPHDTELTRSFAFHIRHQFVTHRHSGILIPLRILLPSPRFAAGSLCLVYDFVIRLVINRKKRRE